MPGPNDPCSIRAQQQLNLQLRLANNIRIPGLSAAATLAAWGNYYYALRVCRRVP